MYGTVTGIPITARFDARTSLEEEQKIQYHLKIALLSKGA
jgi:hypothetical protein